MTHLAVLYVISLFMAWFALHDTYLCSVRSAVENTPNLQYFKLSDSVEQRPS